MSIMEYSITSLLVESDCKFYAAVASILEESPSFILLTHMHA
jgi:hypothetical protein